MLPRLYKNVFDKTAYGNNGLGFIKDCTKCEVTEELNGAYTLTMTVSPTDKLADQIAINRFIKVKANNDDGPQLFEINKLVVKATGDIEIQGQHIKYLGMQNCISNIGNTVGDTVTGNPKTVADYILNDLMFDNLFTFSSDITTEKTFDLSDAPSKKLGDIFGGSDYSFLSEFGGEFHYDNFKINFLESRGSDKGYKLMFGYNMSDYSQTITNDTAYSHIMGYATVTRSDEDSGAIILAGDPVQSSTTQIFPKVKLIDVSSEIRDYFGGSWKVNPKTGENYQDTLDMITYFTNEHFMKKVNRRTVEECNITITYDSELDKMQHLKLGDTVKICYGPDKTTLTEKISKVVYDSLAERYILIEVGEQKPSLIDFVIKKRR